MTCGVFDDWGFAALANVFVGTDFVQPLKRRDARLSNGARMAREGAHPNRTNNLGRPVRRERARSNSRLISISYPMSTRQKETSKEPPNESLKKIPKEPPK